MTPQLNVLMVGLPNSGKTTFLAALYEAIRNEDDDSLGLRLRAEPLEREYWFEISQAWLKLRPANHSNVGEPQRLQLPLRTGDGRELDLAIPDVSGEQFSNAWEGSPLSPAIDQILTEAHGVLLFVRAGAVVPPSFLPPGNSLDTAPVDGQVSEVPPVVPWDSSQAPTQTKLADILETVEQLTRTRLPIAVIVSAWDTADPALRLAPEQWVEFELPLLAQVLRGGAHERPFKVFGVSAQGGNVAEEAERQRLAAIDPPRKRVRIESDVSTGEDLSLPLLWLVEQTL